MSNLKIDIHKCVAPEIGYWAEIPSMPGCITCGDTLDELKKNVIEAAQCWIAMQAELAMECATNNAIAQEPQYA